MQKQPDLTVQNPQKPIFTEGVHFYFENGFMVLTERFLRERGYCCANGCRHCPYGFEKKTPNKNP